MQDLPFTISPAAEGRIRRVVQGATESAVPDNYIPVLKRILSSAFRNSRGEITDHYSGNILSLGWNPPEIAAKFNLGNGGVRPSFEFFRGKSRPRTGHSFRDDKAAISVRSVE
jgi:hypothetical protein